MSVPQHRYGPKRKPLAERFWIKVGRCSADECWPWLGARQPNGYGKMGSGGSHGRTLLAHRVSYELNVGPIPDGLTIDHLCRNPACVNPAHMEVVTGAENILRGESAAARNSRKTHCPAGHPYDEENTLLHRLRTGKYGRECRECNKLRCRDRYQKRKGMA